MGIALRTQPFWGLIPGASSPLMPVRSVPQVHSVSVPSAFLCARPPEIVNAYMELSRRRSPAVPGRNRSLVPRPTARDPFPFPDSAEKKEWVADMEEALRASGMSQAEMKAWATTLLERADRRFLDERSLQGLRSVNASPYAQPLRSRLLMGIAREGAPELTAYAFLEQGLTAIRKTTIPDELQVEILIALAKRQGTAVQQVYTEYLDPILTDYTAALRGLGLSDDAIGERILLVFNRAFQTLGAGIGLQGLLSLSSMTARFQRYGWNGDLTDRAIQLLLKKLPWIALFNLNAWSESGERGLGGWLTELNQTQLPPRKQLEYLEVLSTNARIFYEAFDSPSFFPRSWRVVATLYDQIGQWERTADKAERLRFSGGIAFMPNGLIRRDAPEPIDHVTRLLNETGDLWAATDFLQTFHDAGVSLLAARRIIEVEALAWRGWPLGRVLSELLSRKTPLEIIALFPQQLAWLGDHPLDIQANADEKLRSWREATFGKADE